MTGDLQPVLGNKAECRPWTVETPDPLPASAAVSAPTTPETETQTEKLPVFVPAVWDPHGDGRGQTAGDGAAEDGVLLELAPRQRVSVLAAAPV